MTGTDEETGDLVNPESQPDVFTGSKNEEILRQIDPFAEREGKTLTWRNVNMIVGSKKGDKNVLRDVWGDVPMKNVVALMGPSGAGKTSLLNVLAGRVMTHGNVTIQADIRWDNISVDPSKLSIRQQIAFVAQDDSLLPTATPREAIRFSAKLRLSKEMTDEDLDLITERMLVELGLSKCADTIVGSALIKGISGGERKRTSVGVELVVKPCNVFLDEPTSGLDSYSASQLVKVLKKVAHAGASVLFTIHQPSSEVFSMFDRLLLMKNGMVVSLDTIPGMLEFFSNNGHPCPNLYNPADWVMDVAQIYNEEKLVEDGFFPSSYLSDEEPTPNSVQIQKSITMFSGFNNRSVPLSTELKLLVQREFKNIARNTRPMKARLVFTTVMSLLVGFIFKDAGSRPSDDFASVQSHFGALIMILMLSMFSTAMPSLLSFPDERPVFLREYSTNHYAASTYFLSRLVMEAIVTFIQNLLMILITYWLCGLGMNFFLLVAIVYTLSMTNTAVAVLLGCSVDDSKIAIQFLPVLFVPQLLFAGFFVPPEFIPVWLRWAQYLCSLTYASRLSLIGEFGKCTYPACERLLSITQAYELPKYAYWLLLIGLFLFFRTTALVVLKKKATRFL